MVIVIDASVAVKWYVHEQFTPEALALLDDHAGEVVVPDIFMVEVIGALVRRANIDKILRSKSQESIEQFLGLFSDGLLSTQHFDALLMAKAATMALDLGHPLKDCIYLVLAIELKCPLVTCDEKFAAKARSAYSHVRTLGD